MLKVVADNGQGNPTVSIVNEDGITLLQVTSCRDGLLVSGFNKPTVGIRQGIRPKFSEAKHTDLPETDGHQVAIL